MSKKRLSAFKVLFFFDNTDDEAANILGIVGNPKNKYSKKKLLMAFKDSLQKEAKEIIKNSDIAEFWP